jgi:hypothetical protein
MDNNFRNLKKGDSVYEKNEMFQSVIGSRTGTITIPGSSIRIRGTLEVRRHE